MENDFATEHANLSINGKGFTKQFAFSILEAVPTGMAKQRKSHVTKRNIPREAVLISPHHKKGQLFRISYINVRHNIVPFFLYFSSC